MSYLGSNANQTVELRTTRFRFTATEGQTTFSGNDANGVSLSGVDSSSHVFLNGAKLVTLLQLVQMLYCQLRLF